MSIPTDFNDRMLSLGLARVAEQAAIASAKLIGHGDKFQHAITYRKLEIHPLVYRYHGVIPNDLDTVPIERGDRLPALHRKSIAAARELIQGVSR